METTVDVPDPLPATAAIEDDGPVYSDRDAGSDAAVASSAPAVDLSSEVPGGYGGSLMRLNTRTATAAFVELTECEGGGDEWEGGGQDEPLLARRLSSSRRMSMRSSRPSTPPISAAPSRQRSGPLGSAAGMEQRSTQSNAAAAAAAAASSRQPCAFLDFQSTMFGALNAVITIPVMIAFCKVIFKEPEFAAYQGKLVRLVFLSAATHQLVFTLRSCVPGAVGQVQDVGLIFLSAMASSVVEAGRESGAQVGDTLATCLVLLTSATLLVGMMVVIVARLRVASLVQYVPVPVVGGYLAFVGYFVCVAGVQLATNVQLTNPTDFALLLTLDSITRVLPALCTWQLLHHTVHNFSSPLALPSALLAVVVAFYAVLLLAGFSIQDAQAAKWMPLPDEPMPRFYEVWDLFKLGEWPGCINWAAFPAQLPNLLALFMVVAFGSCMDIAAIQAQYSEELDFDNELELIGVSNMVAGIAGVGYTGSYIFSQTLFNMKHGASGRLTGAVIVVAEVAMFLLPSSPVQYVPNFFFGGLMLWLGIDIMYDWLVMSWGKLRRVEYVIIWLTLVTVTVYGLEGGILMGIIAALASFAFEYSKLSVTCFNVAASRSSYMRTFQERDILDRLSSNMVAISLSGYVFFGSATIISEKALLISDLLLKTADWAENIPAQALDPLEANVRMAKANAPKTLLLDFRKVTGLDATAAQALNVLRQRLTKKGVQLIIAHIPPTRLYIHRLLVAHGVAAGGTIHRGPPSDAEAAAASQTATCLVFDSLSSGLQYCEEALLSTAVQYGACPAHEDSISLRAILEANRSLEWRERPLLPMEMVGDMAAVAAEMEPFLDEMEFLEAGATLFSRGEPPGEVYIVQSGLIGCQIDRTYTRTVGHKTHMLLHTMQYQYPDDGSNLLCDSDDSSHGSSLRLLWNKVTGHETPGGAQAAPQNVHLVEYGPGGILGDLDFFLQRPRSFSAKVLSAPCKLWRLPRSALLRMAAEAPRSFMVLQLMILRASSLSSSHAVEALEMASL